MGASRKGQTTTKAETEGTSSKRQKRKATLVSKVIDKIEKKLAANELKPTVGDYIRLLQLEQELDDEQPTEIKVSWIDPAEKDHASEE